MNSGPEENTTYPQYNFMEAFWEMQECVKNRYVAYAYVFVDSSGIDFFIFGFLRCIDVHIEVA